MDTLLTLPRTLASPPARRLYLHTLLLTLASLALFLLSALSYTLFYNLYIPPLSSTHAVHFQFPHAAPPPSTFLPQTPPPPPHASILDLRALVPRQPYAATLHLTLPASPRNVARENFMARLAVQSSAGATLLDTARPGIVPYTSPLLQTLSTLATAPLLLTGLKREEHRLRIVLAERAVFPQQPVSAVVEIGAGVAVYSARLVFEAELEGLRWWMWRWRTVAAVAGVGVVWAAACFWMGVGWWFVGGRIAGVVVEEEGSEGEEEGSYIGEGEEGDRLEEGAREVRGRRRWPYTPEPTPGAESYTPDDSSEGTALADDEDEGSSVVGELDSGLGTTSEGVSSGRSREAAARRRRRS
ncbi:putative adipose-regulatory protein-domain-containing protein [Geopyxis carbonaria]|nr:putative adipose-regulatory protein-domain-containing protein [Geopyxis carbonaria]